MGWNHQLGSPLVHDLGNMKQKVYDLLQLGDHASPQSKELSHQGRNAVWELQQQQQAQEAQAAQEACEDVLREGSVWKLADRHEAGLPQASEGWRCRCRRNEPGLHLLLVIVTAR